MPGFGRRVRGVAVALLVCFGGLDARALPAAIDPDKGVVPAGIERPTLRLFPQAELAEARRGDPVEARTDGAFPESTLPDVERAWFGPAASLRARVDRTRQALDRIGLRNLDPAARALLLDPSAGSRLERAAGAVRLSPDLPAARMAYAQALWKESGMPVSALGAAMSAVAAMARHLEAALWLDATVANAAVFALLSGALLFLGILCASLAPHAAHDLGDRMSPDSPFFARGALLAALLFLPVALGEGVLGLGLALFALAICYGRGSQRAAAVGCAVAVLVALYPVADRAGHLFADAGADPVAEAVFAVENGFPGRMDLARLENVALSDPLAARALALQAKRAGRLEEANERYASILSPETEDASLLNNAANVRLQLGDLAGAIDLYERAVHAGSSVPLLFNLSQAYGQAIRLEEQDLALAEAQEIDAALVSELARRHGASGRRGVVDVPVKVSELRSRVAKGGHGQRAAAALRARYAPGLMGTSTLATAGAFAAAFVVALLLASRFRPSHWCARCGARLCPRCDRNRGSAELCVGCTRLFRRPDTIEPGLRARRLEELRSRKAKIDRFVLVASLGVPGAAGVFAQRPLLAVAATFLAGLVVSCFVWSGGAVPDPLAVGGAGSFAFVAAGLVFLLAYGLALGLALAARRSR